MQGMASTKRRTEYLASRALVKQATDIYCASKKTTWRLQEMPVGPPRVLISGSRIYTSLSHSNGFICFALGSSRLGIDIELRNPERDFIAASALFMNPKEQHECEQTIDKSNYFYRIWCAKEALFKALPLKDQTPLHTLSYDRLTNNDDDWHLQELPLGEFQLALVCQERINDANLNLIELQIQTT